jgi:hypothetical protein
MDLRELALMALDKSQQPREAAESPSKPSSTVSISSPPNSLVLRQSDDLPLTLQVPHEPEQAPYDHYRDPPLPWEMSGEFPPLGL